MARSSPTLLTKHLHNGQSPKLGVEALWIVMDGKNGVPMGSPSQSHASEDTWVWFEIGCPIPSFSRWGLNYNAPFADTPVYIIFLRCIPSLNPHSLITFPYVPIFPPFFRLYPHSIPILPNYSIHPYSISQGYFHTHFFHTHFFHKKLATFKYFPHGYFQVCQFSILPVFYLFCGFPPFNLQQVI